DPLSGSLLTETNNYGQTVRYSYDEFRRLNNQTMMGKDYQLVHTDQDDAITQVQATVRLYERTD
ncbi:hypothetical protein ACWKW1_23680, partial [Brevibacillus parabrevis]